jgi:5-enolpyruvylshikimate-3-phosphate synthase
MNLIVQKTLVLQGIAVPPGSKSQSIRALLLALVSEGESALGNILDSEDTRDAISTCRGLGAEISARENKLILHSQGLPLKPRELMIHTGNSGITTRFVMPLLGLRQNAQDGIILDCSEQMRAKGRDCGHYFTICIRVVDGFTVSVAGQRNNCRGFT